MEIEKINKSKLRFDDSGVNDSRLDFLFENALETPWGKFVGFGEDVYIPYGEKFYQNDVVPIYLSLVKDRKGGVHFFATVVFEDGEDNSFGEVVSSYSQYRIHEAEFKVEEGENGPLIVLPKGLCNGRYYDKGESFRCVKWNGSVHDFLYFLNGIEDSKGEGRFYKQIDRLRRFLPFKFKASDYVGLLVAGSCKTESGVEFRVSKASLIEVKTDRGFYDLDSVKFFMDDKSSVKPVLFPRKDSFGFFQNNVEVYDFKVPSELVNAVIGKAETLNIEGVLMKVGFLEKQSCYYCQVDGNDGNLFAFVGSGLKDIRSAIGVDEDIVYVDCLDGKNDIAKEVFKDMVSGIEEEQRAIEEESRGLGFEVRI